MTLPKVFANIDTGKVCMLSNILLTQTNQSFIDDQKILIPITNNELLDATQPSAFEFLGLSKKQRLYGFLGCLVGQCRFFFFSIESLHAVWYTHDFPPTPFFVGLGGFVVSLIGSILFVFGSIVSFALLYILGILISLTGTGFLVGSALLILFFIFFSKVYKTDQDGSCPFLPHWLETTRSRLLFYSCRCSSPVIMVFVAAFVIKSDVLVLVFAILTFFSYTWYSLSCKNVNFSETTSMNHANSMSHNLSRYTICSRISQQGGRLGGLVNPGGLQ
ncbi:hypothetical protein VP01_1790g2 [Puccinia sorghi]|uniref:Transmembrane protein n=1 Tax=Puccinia sorghi TaxID=27349 RepID=A0A0L6VEG0_9BASI|nr:hypothetical protein VP01_1790g2 [Puccinia sorghi]